jgi:hypothetical protein
MIEIGLAGYFGMAEAMGIIGTMFVVLYFSGKQTQKLSEDIETKVLNDLAQMMHALHEILVEHQELIKVLEKLNVNSPEVAYAYDILFTFAHVFDMSQKSVKRK